MTTIPDDILEASVNGDIDRVAAWIAGDEIERAQIADALYAERERCAQLLTRVAGQPQAIRLHCGEMTAQEMRTVRAALHWMATEIRSGRPLPNP